MDKRSCVIPILAGAIGVFAACSGSELGAEPSDDGGTVSPAAASGGGSGGVSSSSSSSGAPASSSSSSSGSVGPRADATVEGGSSRDNAEGGVSSGDASASFGAEGEAAVDEDGSSAPEIDGAVDPESGLPGTIRIAFNPMYSGYIPTSTTHTFQVPAIVVGVSGVNVVWTASDTSAAALEPDPQTGGVMITVLATGTFAIHAQLGTESWSAPLIVTAFTQADWMAGNARCNDGVPLEDPFTDAAGPPGPPPGGFAVPTPIGPSPFEPTDGGPGPACTNCHGPGSNGGIFEGIAWTPEQTAGFSDQQLVDIIVNGIIPDGGYYDSATIPYAYWQYFHRWIDLNTDQQRGIVAYLRTLASSPSGMADFGGLGGTP